MYVAALGVHSKRNNNSFEVPAGCGKTYIIMMMGWYYLADSYEVEVVVLNQILWEQMAFYNNEFC